MLFTVTFERIERIEGVPIAAESEEQAMQYLHSHVDWRQDGSYPDGEVRIVAVRRIDDPASSPFEASINCWGRLTEDGGDIAAYEAFYWEETRFPDLDSDDDEENELAIDEWRARLLSYKTMFEEKQKPIDN